MVSSLADALPEWLKVGNRVLLTSRPYGLDDEGLRRLGLTQAPLEPLPKQLQDLFIARWFHALDKPEQTKDLIATIREREYLAPLVENPMMLTALCILYDSGGKLPEDRYDLYRRIVNNVLFHRFRDEARQREPARARLEAIAYGMHVGDKDAPRESPAAEISYLEIERILRAFMAESPYEQRGRLEPVEQRDQLLNQSGVLIPKSKHRATFYHLSVQEFLAAERILHTEDDLLPIFRARSAIAEWRATLMFLFAGQIAAKTPRWGTEMLAKLIEDLIRCDLRIKLPSAAFIAEAIDLCVAKNYDVPMKLKKLLCGLAIKDDMDLQVRQALGLTLGRVGDPRIFDLSDPAGYVEIPPGTYPYGPKGEAIEITAPFQLGRYPVTNGQFVAFIDAGGYDKQEWWSEDGWNWLQGRKVVKPRFWSDGRWNAQNQPVVGVSFWEAEACSRWAGGRLPSDGEWEVAARGPNSLEYPWGNFWRDGICNTREAGLGVTSPVGLFPGARQADRTIDDLAGNVWEWCDTLYNSADRSSPSDRVLRGGAWNYDQAHANSLVRHNSKPFNRFDCVGFRVVR
ncbi:SUMF1/EgtB/PvdO family nonheme iron enzyme [Defluviicoccus vanus]|uniref:SUMF1/EgtB/PvdO family nonheme iron enzyme n=1 Tax=Defluviicoccus vanus TaxID=111831 RepID=A0A7H1N6V8_9PROT|nr:SUMF1/EgtB/PvdO family nonheme iron enzyme [Defluviicoccus vanus]